MNRSRFAAVLLSLLIPAAAIAGNGVASLSVTKHSSLASVAIRANVHGDDDSSAVCTIWAGWDRDHLDTGMVMVRRTGTNMHEGRVLWVPQGRTFYYQVRALDDGVETRSAIDTASCAQVRPNVATGIVVYVNQATGSAGNSGLTPALPKATINQAVAVLMASADSGAFGGIIVAPGHYHERVDLTFGRDGKPRFLSGDRTNRDGTIICGANEHGEAGRKDNTNPIVWQARPPAAGTAHNGVYRAFFSDDSAGTSYGDSIGSVILNDNEYLHRKTSLAALFADSTGTVGTGLAAGGEKSGWYWTADTLYIKRRDLTSPVGTTPYFGYRTQLVAIAGRNWSVRNLTIRYGGGKLLDTSNGAEEDPGTAGDGIINVRTTGVNSSGLVVDSCRIYGNMGLGVYAAYGSSTIRCDSATVANSVFSGLSIGSMTYAEAKGRIEEDANVLKVTGSHSNVYRNVLTETHNGIQTGPSSGDADTTWGNYGEVHGNVLTTMSDDAIELDTAIGTNLLVCSNTTDNTGSGISCTPIHTGPAFVIENTCTRFERGVKTGNDGNGIVHFYQNTFVSEFHRGTAATTYGYEGGSGGTVGPQLHLNNIYAGRRGINGPNDESEEVLFNYNLVDSTAGYPLLRHGGVDNINWSTWQGLGYEANGLYGPVRLVNLPGDTRRWVDARILSTSPAFETGRRITGVNTGLDGNRYTGTAPNIGSKVCLTCARQTQTDR